MNDQSSMTNEQRASQSQIAMNKSHFFVGIGHWGFTGHWSLIIGHFQRASVLECGSPLPLLERSSRESARGLAHSKTCRGKVGHEFATAPTFSISLPC